MLRQLAIHNVVLVERLELEFEPGLGVLTGETGAGKSILLDALGLALGARADTALVRAGRGRRVGVAPRSSCRRTIRPIALLAEQGIELEPGEPLIIRRTLKSDGGSRAFVGGARVPAGLLRDLGALAVEIHGQHDDRGLLNPQGPPRLARRVRQARRRRRSSAAWAEVTRIEARAGSRRAPRPRRPSATANGSSMRRAEIEALAPEEGEETRLAEERAAMQAGAQGRRIADRARRAARRIGRRAGAAAPGGAADRARRRRSSACSPRRWRRSTAR